MKTSITDDRTENHKSTHCWAVIARDTVMSRWGRAKGGISRVAWACLSRSDASKVYDWVKTRSEMKSVSIVDLRTYKPSSRDATFHIYVLNKNHVAFK
jgi:hypothetical protein